MNRRFLMWGGGAALIVVVLSAIAWLPPLLQSWHADPTPTITPTPLPPALASIQVQVQDAETGHPIAGANVQIGPAQGQTDAQGLYTVRLKNQTTYALYIQATRYQDVQQQVAISQPLPSSTATLSIPMSLNQTSGQVTDEQGRSLADATLTFNGTPASLDTQGRFTLHGVSKGDIISASRMGFVTQQVEYDGAPLQLVLAALSAETRVYDALTGLAVSGASVCVGQNCAITDLQGAAALRAIPSQATLSIERGGYLSATLVWDGAAVLTTTLHPQMLQGAIRDAVTGRPITNAILLVNGQIWPLDEQGRYHLPDLTQVYTLFVKSPGYERITIPVDPDTTAVRYDALDPCQDAGVQPCADLVLRPFAVRGVYTNFNLLMWDKKRMLQVIDMVDRSPILNAIVVDIKSDRGLLAFETDDPIVASGKAMSTPRLPVAEFLRLCQEKHIYTIARMVIFKDDALIKARPELAVRHPNGAIFYDREGLAWGDPTRPEVWEYNLAITRVVIEMGFDEVQYDYLRYPSDSTSVEVVRALIYSIPYSFESRIAAISGFVAAAKDLVNGTTSFLSIDLFGSVLSLPPEQDMRIGQRLMDLAPHADYVCPMVYPSTFIPGNLGLEKPSAAPYEVIARSMRYGQQRTDTLLRPWLQHYWYGRFPIAEQRRAAEAATDAGWCYWNAGAQYDELFFIPPEHLQP